MNVPEVTLTNMDICSSSRTSFNAPISFHVTSGIVAKPSLFAEGCTTFNAAWEQQTHTEVTAAGVEIELRSGLPETRKSPTDLTHDKAPSILYNRLIVTLS